MPKRKKIEIVYPTCGNFYYVTSAYSGNRYTPMEYVTLLFQSLAKANEENIELPLARVLSTNNYRRSNHLYPIGGVVKDFTFHHLGFSKLDPAPTFHCYKCRQSTTPDMLGLCPNCTQPFNFYKLYRSPKYKHTIPSIVQEKHVVDIRKFNSSDNADAMFEVTFGGEDPALADAVDEASDVIRDRIVRAIDVSAQSTYPNVRVTRSIPFRSRPIGTLRTPRR